MVLIMENQKSELVYLPIEYFTSHTSIRSLFCVTFLACLYGRTGSYCHPVWASHFKVLQQSFLCKGQGTVRLAVLYRNRSSSYLTVIFRLQKRRKKRIRKKMRRCSQDKKQVKISRKPRRCQPSRLTKKLINLSERIHENIRCFA